MIEGLEYPERDQAGNYVSGRSNVLTWVLTSGCWPPKLSFTCFSVDQYEFSQGSNAFTLAHLLPFCIRLCERIPIGNFCHISRLLFQQSAVIVQQRRSLPWAYPHANLLRSYWYDMFEVLVRAIAV